MVAPAALLEYIDSASIALSLADPTQDDAPLVSVNDAFCKLSGYDKEAVIGRNCRFLQDNLRDQSGVEEIRTFLDGNAETRKVRTKIINRRNDGEWFVNLLSISRICDSEGRTCLLFGSQFDLGVAKEDELHDYIQKLSGHIVATRDLLSPHQLQMTGSVTALADAANAIAQAKLLIGGLDSSLS